jgi:hypothetical protein
MMNSIKLNNANSILGGSGSSSALPGISGDLLQQWSMLGANSDAYRKLLEAEKNGGVRPKDTIELASDKYLNENYNANTKTYTQPKYVSPVDAVQVDPDATTGDQFEDMRALALAAISNPDKMTSTHYDFFEKMRQNIASNLNTKGGSSSGGATTAEEAKAAEAKATVDYRLLLDNQSFVVAGSGGEQTYNFSAGATLEDVVNEINADTAETGVKASLVENDDGKYEVTFSSAKEGKDQFVRIDQKIGDLFAASGSSLSGTGTDAVEGTGGETVATSDDTQAAMVAGTPYGKLFEDNAFTVQGAKGSHSFSFAKGTDAAAIVEAINAEAEKTGVKAEAIYADDGTVAGIGLLADKAGSGNYIQVRQDKGELFAAEGKTASVAGSSAGKDADSGPSIASLSDLGKVTVGDQVYSFADLAPNGKASLSKNPDIALAVLDQAIKDIAEGRAEVKGFDASELYVPGVTTGAEPASTASTNTREYNNYGHQGITDWLNKYAVDNDG